MHLTRTDKVHYLEADRIAATGVAAAGFTTRHEGVSRPPYNSLNLGSNTLDAPHSVDGNRSILARALEGGARDVVTVTQVHGTDLLIIDSANPDYTHFQKLECDGVVTSVPGIIIGVTVADCVPVLLLDPVKRVAAALHAGWKGTAGNICRSGVEAMKSVFGCRPQDIVAAVGPGICGSCYEVDEPVVKAFRKSGQEFGSFAADAGEGKWRLDLSAANVRQLLDAGLLRKNVETTEMCVSCLPDLFFSYRRDGGETGRQMGFILLREEQRKG